nr:unnamed protein product [Digitaria exilis]
MKHWKLRKMGTTYPKPEVYVFMKSKFIEVEEGICQVVSHLWLGSEIFAGSSSNVASSSSASSPLSSSAPTSSKKGAKTKFEKKLAAFIKNQIETDSSKVHGDGFRAGYPAVERYGLRRTLDHIKLVMQRK